MSVRPRPTLAPRAALKLAACSAALLLGLVGCASGGDGTAVGETDTGKAAGETSMTDEEYTAKLLAWERDLAQCFRDKGLDVTDPTPEGGWADITPEMQELSPECQKEIGEAPVRALSAEEKAEGARQQLEYDTKFAGCMRDLGYDMADPKPGEPAAAPPANASITDQEKCSTEAVAG